MRNRLCVSAFIILVLLSNVASASRSRANSVCSQGSTAGWFQFISDPTLPYRGFCKLYVVGPFAVIGVWVDAVPFKKARFTVPDPPFGTLVGETWLFPHTGDRASGLELDMGGCTQAGLVKLGDLYIVVGPEVDPNICAPWTVGVGELQNCAGVWLQAEYIPQQASKSNSSCICPGAQFCYSLPPYDLLPADGATNVPTNVVLTWVAPYGEDSYPGCYVFISTDPSCATARYFKVPCDNDTFAPDFLQPGTTYYWRTSWGEDPQWGCDGESAYQSFTTAPIVPVNASTWGQVKAMYRQ